MIVSSCKLFKAFSVVRNFSSIPVDTQRRREHCHLEYCNKTLTRCLRLLSQVNVLQVSKTSFFYRLDRNEANLKQQNEREREPSVLSFCLRILQSKIFFCLRLILVLTVFLVSFLDWVYTRGNCSRFETNLERFAT